MDGVKPPRMVDVAEAAGVSQTTASFVLNDRDASIPEETRQRVLDAAAKLGYRTNRMASALAGRRSGALGVVVPDGLAGGAPCLLGRLAARCEAAGYRLMLEPRTPAQAPERAVGALLDWRVEGAVVWHDDETDVTPLLQAGVPLVCVGTAAPPDSADGIWVDEADGVRRAVRALLDAGHTEFLYLTDGADMHRLRRKVVQRTLANAGSMARECACLGDGPAEARQAVADTAAEGERYTAVVCDTSNLAMGALSGLRSVGLGVPGDVSVVALEDTGEAAHLSPALTALESGFAELMARGLEYLLQRLREAPGGRQRLLLTPRLVCRGSTGTRNAAAEPPPLVADAPRARGTLADN